VRVDSCGYAGYAPPPAFDPLFAKVIGQGLSLEAAVDRTRRALRDFHIAGVPTNIDDLLTYLAMPSVRSGDARTTLVDEAPKTTPSGTGGLVAFLSEHGAAPGGGSGAAAAQATLAELPHEDGDEVLRAPLTASLLELRAQEGDAVAAGTALAVITAMKMETVVTAPCDGVVVSVLAAAPGSTVAAGQALVVLRPTSVTADDIARSTRPTETWEPVLAQVDTLRSIAHARLAPGSTDPGVVRQRSRGKLTCRERISELLDEGSFREVGSIAGFISYGADGAIDDFTPANHVGGTGTVDGRPVIVCADDFTSRGGHSDGAIGTKSTHLDRLAIELRVPSIRLLDGSSGGGSVATMVPQQRKEGEATAQESEGAISAGKPRVSGTGGSFLPGHLFSKMYADQLATVPVVNVLMGSVVGLGAAKAVLGHFSVMLRDTAQLFVAGPPVVRHAVGYEVTKEDLGGWHIHCRNGSVDNLAETEEDALAQTRRFLSYLPQSVDEVSPAVTPGPDDHPDRRDEELLTIIPRKRTMTFDMRRAIELMADRGSFFEIGPLWGTDQIVGFARFAGRVVGVLASDSRHPNGGAMTADGCSKLIRHLDLCDLFHIPVLNLVDSPGFAVGIEHEIASTIRRGGEWMVAFAQVTAPVCTVVIRRSFGVAGNNYATPREQPSVRYVWPAADMGGIPPEGGIEAAYKRQLAEAEDPEAFRAELMARIESARGPLGPLSKFQVEEMIDPRDTRRLVCEWLDLAYRIVSRPNRLGSRPLQFRP
jgi:acetyl-CoA carboxylase carboxyltransferase component/biotin carboxyl carrier protein